MNTYYPDRVERLNKVLETVKTTVKLPLFYEASIVQPLHAALQDACINYLLSSLRASNPQKTYNYTRDILDLYYHDILNLHNMTPNGLVLPKKDNLLEYNVLHKTVCNIFRQFDIDDHVNIIHAPINIRVVNGKRTIIDERPRASSKLHSDIWAGEFSNTIMLFLTTLGDVKNGIEFYEPNRRFYDEFCKPLNDYLEGSELERDSIKYDCSLRDGFAYFTDPFLLHRTIKKTPRLRLSIDFRFIPNETCPTDIEVETQRHKNYIPLSEWYEIGESTLLYTDVSIATSKAEEIGPKNAYAADYEFRRINVG